MSAEINTNNNISATEEPKDISTLDYLKQKLNDKAPKVNWRTVAKIGTGVTFALTSAGVIGGLNTLNQAVEAKGKPSDTCEVDPNYTPGLGDEQGRGCPKSDPNPNGCLHGEPDCITKTPAPKKTETSVPTISETNTGVPPIKSETKTSVPTVAKTTEVKPTATQTAKATVTRFVTSTATLIQKINPTKTPTSTATSRPTSSFELKAVTTANAVCPTPVNADCNPCLEERRQANALEAIATTDAQRLQLEQAVATDNAVNRNGINSVPFPGAQDNANKDALKNILLSSALVVGGGTGFKYRKEIYQTAAKVANNFKNKAH